MLLLPLLLLLYKEPCVVDVCVGVKWVVVCIEWMDS